MVHAYSLSTSLQNYLHSMQWNSLDYFISSVSRRNSRSIYQYVCELNDIHGRNLTNHNYHLLKRTCVTVFLFLNISASLPLVITSKVKRRNKSTTNELTLLTLLGEMRLSPVSPTNFFCTSSSFLKLST